MITVPIRTSLAPLVPQIESRVPNRFADTVRERGIDVRYDVLRDPLQLAMIGGGLHARTKIRYAMEACRGRFPCISCGFGEPRREADVTLHTKLEWDPSWRIRSSTTLLPVHYGRRCEVTWLDIDITRRFVAPVVEEQLGTAARIIDRNTPALTSIRRDAEEIWTSLQTPVELAPRTWLVLEPNEVALTPISGSGASITSTLVLHALTRVVIGERPPPSRKPLPPLRVVPAADSSGIRVPFDIHIGWDDATRILAREVAGKTFTAGGKPLTIESVRLAPADGGKVQIEAMIDYRGGLLRNYQGLIFLEGTPRFDPVTQTVVLPDLDYSLDASRSNPLLRIAERAVHDSVRDRLRAGARLPLAGRIAEMRGEITRALTRQLAPGVALRGHIDAIQPLAVTPLQDILLVRVVATGRADVQIALAPR